MFRKVYTVALFICLAVISTALTLSYDHIWLKGSVFTSASMEQLRFSETAQYNTTLWNEQFGASVTVEWKDLTLTSGITEHVRNGYLISRMNDNYLIWDASITWKLLHKNAQLKAYFNDILNQIDTFYAQKSAYQNIYSWHDQMHHYINISFIYHFDAKEKKK